MYANTALTGVVWELQLEDMTLTKCIQACVSRSAKFALTKDDQCYCLNTLPTADKAPFTQCNRSCPANDMQACGGLLDGYYTVTKGRQSIFVMVHGGGIIKYIGEVYRYFSVCFSVNVALSCRCIYCHCCIYSI